MPLISDNLDALRARLLQEQNALCAQLDFKNCITLDEIHTAAGADLAYWNAPDGTQQAVCCIAVIDVQTHAVIARTRAYGEITVPYMPGFLAFRELPLIQEAFAQLESRPDLLVLDGNGILHPRKMGIAAHAGAVLGIPAMGIAKTYYRVQDTDYTEPEREAGSFTDIVIDGEVRGRVLRTHTDVKPVFVSVGNRISLDSAVVFALRMTEKESHIPLPTRIADMDTHIARAEATAQYHE